MDPSWTPREQFRAGDDLGLERDRPSRGDGDAGRVNLLDINFSKLLGAYVGVFAMIGVLVGRLAFRNHVPASTWAGLAVILGGSLIVHFGRGG